MKFELCLHKIAYMRRCVLDDVIVCMLNIVEKYLVLKENKSNTLIVNMMRISLHINVIYLTVKCQAWKYNTSKLI